MYSIYTLNDFIKLAEPYVLELHLEINNTATIRLFNRTTGATTSIECVDFDRIYTAIEKLKDELNLRNPEIGFAQLARYVEPLHFGIYHNANLPGFVVTLSSEKSHESMIVSYDGMKNIGEHITTLKMLVLDNDQMKEDNEK